MIRGLRDGKDPKGVARDIGVGWPCVRSIINRQPDVRKVYIETYPLRYPHKEGPPLKIVNPLREIAT